MSGHALTAFLVLGETLTVANALLIASPYAAVANELALGALAWRTIHLVRASVQA